MDVYGQGEVAHEAPDDGELLVVLFSEDGRCRAQDLEEFENCGAHSLEVTGAGGSAEVSGEEGLPDHDGMVGRVEFRGGRSEHRVHTQLFTEGEICLKGARVVCQIAWPVELQGIEKDGSQDRAIFVRYFSGCPDEGGMSIVQGSHGGNQHSGCGHVRDVGR